MSLVRVIVPAMSILMLGACSNESELRCSRDTLYRDAGSTGTLRIPDDLSVPDESESLSIPATAPEAPDNGETAGACLEESPAFSGTPQP
jgi:uncharacterized lipoprotein